MQGSAVVETLMPLNSAQSVTINSFPQSHSLFRWRPGCVRRTVSQTDDSVCACVRACVVEPVEMGALLPLLFHSTNNVEDSI